jgi:hypothetical protein
MDPSLVRLTGLSFPELPSRPPRWMRDNAPLDEGAKLSLCTDEPGTYYDAIGAEIRRQLEPFGLAVRRVRTTGSVENLRRLRDGRCDAALAQNDVYLMQLIDEPTSAATCRPTPTRTSRPAWLNGAILETVTVGSSLFVAKRWARRHPQEYRLLLDAVSQTRAELLKPLEVRRAVRPWIDGLRKAGLPE